MTKNEELREAPCPHCNQGAEIERLRELLRAGINLMRPVAEYEGELAWLRDAVGSPLPGTFFVGNSRWTHVDTALPDADISVLVWDGSDMDMGLWDGGWIRAGDTLEPLSGVTHWRDVPEPPPLDETGRG